MVQKSTGGKKSDRAAVDAKFFIKLIRLLKIIVPGLFTPEVQREREREL